MLPVLIQENLKSIAKDSFGRRLLAGERIKTTNCPALKSIGLKNNNADYLNNSRQTFPKTYIPNGYVDVLSVKFIQENKLIHGNKVLPFITPRITEIDCEDDFNYLEFEVEKNPELINNLF